MPFFDIFASPRWSPLRMRTKVVSFFIFSRAFKPKKLRPYDQRWLKQPQGGPTLTTSISPLGNNKKRYLRGAWRDRDTNDIFAHCSLIFYFLDFKFSNFVCPSELHRLIWFCLKNSFRKKKTIRKTTQNALASSIFIVLSIALKLGTLLLHTQAQNRLLQNF